MAPHPTAARPRSVVMQARRLPLAALALMLVPIVAHAYDAPTHQAMSIVAVRRADCKVDDYLKNELLVPQGIETTAGSNSFVDRLQDGARDEDEQSTPRPRNHFYNPITGNGLDDIFSGNSSLQWAWDHPDNQQDWHAARDAYFRFFTAGTKAERTQAMGDAFWDLGHVIHLIQDLGQPQHVRNDAHITHFPGAPFEDYCSIRYRTPETVGSLGTAPIPQLVPGPGPFANIPNSFSGFWDSGQYRGQDDFAGFTLAPGLAEYSNAYFITDDTMFGTFQLGVLPRAGMPPLQVRLRTPFFSTNHSTSANHRFNGPRLADTDLASFYPATTSSVTVYRGGEGTTGATHYLTLNTRGPGGAIIHTTRNICLLNGDNYIGFDDNTYQAYAEQLVPMAVSYSAGLLNYFFRGKLDIEVRWIEAQQQYQITVTNRSGADLGAGQWSLYQDDGSDNRSSVGASFNYPGTLADGGSFTGTFAAAERSGGYTLVFHGTLGDEKDWAVVGKRFELVRVLITWDPKSDQDLYMWGPDGSLIGYYSKVSSYGELDNDNIGGTGPENITLKDMREGNYQFMIDYYRDWWKEYYYDQPSNTCIPYDTPINYPEDYGYDPCFEPTPITVTVKTYHNAASPVRTQTFTAVWPDYGYYLPGSGLGEGQLDDAWAVVQTVTVDADRNVTITGTTPQTAPPPATRPYVRAVAASPPPSKAGVPTTVNLTSKAMAAKPTGVK